MKTIINFLIDFTPFKVYAYIMLVIAPVIWYFAGRIIYYRAGRRMAYDPYQLIGIAAFLLTVIRKLLVIGAFFLLALELFNELVKV